MAKSAIQCGLLLAGLVLFAMGAAFADQKEAKAPKSGSPSEVTAKSEFDDGGDPRLPRAAARIPNPLNPGQRFLQMTPEEQERFMEKANPRLQVRLRQAIENYKRRPQAQKDRLFRQYQILNGLPPAMQVLITRRIAAFNNQLSDERRLVVGQELMRLHRMPEAARAARLHSEGFRTRFSADEQQILVDLSENIPADYPLGR